MRQGTRLSIRVSVSAAFLVVVASLAVTGLGQIESRSQTKSQTPSPGAGQESPPDDIPLCTGALPVPSAGHEASHAKPHSHSVTLSWNAATPASHSPGDGIKGYYVYRSLTSHAYTGADRISESPLRATQCVDTTVKPRETYFYVVKAVTQEGKQSDASAEITARVPSP
jgi:hypothetical protein